MAQVLSQAEIDALLSGVVNQQVPGAGTDAADVNLDRIQKQPQTGGANEAKLYDFTRS